MKSFKEYCHEYEKAIQDSLLKNPTPKYTVKRCVWILSKWELDNNVNPWEKEKYIKALQEVEKTDPDLINELSDGYEIMMQAMKEQKGGK